MKKVDILSNSFGALSVSGDDIEEVIKVAECTVIIDTPCNEEIELNLLSTCHLRSIEIRKPCHLVIQGNGFGLLVKNTRFAEPAIGPLPYFVSSGRFQTNFVDFKLTICNCSEVSISSKNPNFSVGCSGYIFQDINLKIVDCQNVSLSGFDCTGKRPKNLVKKVINESARPDSTKLSSDFTYLYEEDLIQLKQERAKREEGFKSFTQYKYPLHNTAIYEKLRESCTSGDYTGVLQEVYCLKDVTDVAASFAMLIDEGPEYAYENYFSGKFKAHIDFTRELFFKELEFMKSAGKFYPHTMSMRLFNALSDLFWSFREFYLNDSSEETPEPFFSKLNIPDSMYEDWMNIKDEIILKSAPKRYLYGVAIITEPSQSDGLVTLDTVIENAKSIDFIKEDVTLQKLDLF